MKTTLEAALLRWSVTCAARADFAAGYTALIGPFLSGWFARDMGASEPATLGRFASSWRAGWAECDLHLRILAREEQHPFVAAASPKPMGPDGGECRTCGPGARDGVHRG